MRLTGKWLGGQGTLAEIKAAYAWANVPSIWALPFWLIAIVIGGPDIFKSQLSSIYISILAILIGITGFWNLITFLIYLKEVQKFSMFKSILNIAFVSMIMAIVTWCLFFVHPLAQYIKLI